MPKYQGLITITGWGTAEIEADNADQARAKWAAHGFEFVKHNPEYDFEEIEEIDGDDTNDEEVDST